jgi:hypothetical protein
MKPRKILSYLVSPGKGNPDPEPVIGTAIPLSGLLYKMLSEVFVRSEDECKVPIRFLMSPEGEQRNEVRSHVVNLLKRPTLLKGSVLAQRLRDVTTGKSGLGLLFFIFGREGDLHKLVLSRFPADQGILAEAKKEGLEVEFVERVFMKSAKTYKAALYQGRSVDADFWAGHAVDKQINAPQDYLARYWIHDFLASDFKTTSKAGSKRLAVALKEASKSAPSIQVKQEIISAAILAQGFSGRTVSIRALTDQLRLSNPAREAIESHFHGNDTLLEDTFVLDREEFQRYTTYASIELDHGGILTAPTEKFKECFQQETVNEEESEYRFSTTGRIVDERIKGRR